MECLEATPGGGRVAIDGTGNANRIRFSSGSDVPAHASAAYGAFSAARADRAKRAGLELVAAAVTVATLATLATLANLATVTAGVGSHEPSLAHKCRGFTLGRKDTGMPNVTADRADIAALPTFAQTAEMIGIHPSGIGRAVKRLGIAPILWGKRDKHLRGSDGARGGRST